MASPDDTPLIGSKAERDNLYNALMTPGGVPDDIRQRAAQEVLKWDEGSAKVQSDYKSVPFGQRLMQNQQIDARAQGEAGRQLADIAPEAGVRAVEGVGQLGMQGFHALGTMGDFIGKNILHASDTASLNGQGTFGKYFNPGSDQRLDDFATGVSSRRSEWTAAMVQKYGADAPMTQAADLGAMIMSIPFLSGPRAAVSGIPATRALASALNGPEYRFGSTVAADMGRGAIAAGSVFDPAATRLADKYGRMTIGALFPAVLTGGATLFGGLQNGIARKIAARADPASLAGETAAATFFDTVGTAPLNKMPLSAGQLTGDPRIISLESRAMNQLGTQFFKQQNVDFSDGVKAMVATLDPHVPGGYGAAQIGSDTYEALAKLNGDIRTTASKVYTAGLGNAQKMSDLMDAQRGPVSFVVPLPNLKAQLAKVVEETGNPFALADPAVKARLQPILDLINDPSKLGLNVKGVIGALKGLNAGKQYTGAATNGAAGGTGDVAEGIRKSLVSALHDDLDAAANAPPGTMPVPAGYKGPTTGDIINTIRATNKAYGGYMDQVRTLDNSLVNRVFGNAEALSEPTVALQKFINADPVAQKYAIGILQDRAPQVLQGMRAAMIQNAFQRATDLVQPANSGQFSLETFNKELFGQGFMRSGLLTPDMVKWGSAAGGYMKSIMNFAPNAKSGTPLWAEDLAINVVSLSPEFMARLAARVGYGTQAEKLFFTPEGLAALRTVANLRSVPREQSIGAAMYMLGLAQLDGDAQQKAVQMVNKANIDTASQNMPTSGPPGMR